MKLPTKEHARRAFKPHKLKFVSWTSFWLGWNLCRKWFTNNSVEEYCAQIKKPLKTPFK